MSNFTDFFPAPGGGGGGGGIPKYQEFITSGTFTPTQALIDAGGRLAYFIVGGGAQGAVDTNYGGAGGGVEYGYMTLSNTNGCSVTVGAAGGAGAAGGSSIVVFSSAGGTDITAVGAYIQYASYGQQRNTLGANWAGEINDKASPGTGLFGYAAGGSRKPDSPFPGVTQARANSGQGSPNSITAGTGFIRLTWFE